MEGACLTVQMKWTSRVTEPEGAKKDVEGPRPEAWSRSSRRRGVVKVEPVDPAMSSTEENWRRGR